ncbi:CheW protein (modular protein) [Rhodospirillaceae bacterium LM-1]|nr:CheW protein (modular protein) [Rhodospirillaceae bacterium LM-1]
MPDHVVAATFGKQMNLKTSAPDTLLVFTEGGILCALPASAVQEVVFLPELSRPPGMPSILEGMMTLDGAPVPVLRVARLLGLPASPTGIYTPVMILKNAKAALAVESMDDIYRLSAKDMVKAKPGLAFNDCLMGEVRLKERVVHVLSVDRLLLTEEKRRVEEFKTVVLARLSGDGAQP